MGLSTPLIGELSFFSPSSFLGVLALGTTDVLGGDITIAVGPIGDPTLGEPAVGDVILTEPDGDLTLGDLAGEV